MNRSSGALLCFVFLPMLAGGAAIAGVQEPAAPPSGAAPPRDLTREECRRLVMAHNLNVQAGRAGWKAKRAQYEGAWGLFEPDLVGSVKREKNERQNTVEQYISQNASYFREENNRYNAAIEDLLPTGAKLRFGYTLSDLYNNLHTNTASRLDHQYESFLGVSLTQPLLRDAGVGTTLSRVRLARAESEAAYQDYRRGLMQSIGGVESAYWDLYLAQERERLRRDSVALAEKVLTDNRERVKAGKMSDLEVLQAQAGVAERRTLAAAAEQDRVEAENRLRTFFAEPADAPARLSAAEAPAVRPPPADPDRLLADAVERHPDYRTRYWQARQEDVRLAYLRNQRWPQLDLKASYGLNGLGDDTGSSWDQVSDGTYEAWSVGVEVRIPLGGGRAQRKEMESARHRRQQALLQLKAAEIEIRNALDSAVRRLGSAQRQTEDYRSVADFSRKVLDTELQRLDAGQSDSRKVLDAEQDVVAARIAVARSLVRYEKTRLEMELASGNLLIDRGLENADETGRASAAGEDGT